MNLKNTIKKTESLQKRLGDDENQICNNHELRIRLYTGGTFSGEDRIFLFFFFWCGGGRERGVQKKYPIKLQQKQQTYYTLS